MHESNSINFGNDAPEGRELKSACEHMARELVEGVRHGFFEMSVTVEMMQSKKNASP
jgi:hypothetical protein